MIVARSLLSLMCLVSVFSVAALAQSAPGNPVPPGFKLSPLARATVFVRDVDESLELYLDILGLRVRFDRDFPDDRFNTILGTKGATTRVRILQSGDVVYGNVGLFQLSGGDTPAASAPSAATRVNPGDVALVFNTTNIDGIAAAVKAAGYPIIAMPMALFPREDMEVQPLEMLFRDRDGTLVNLIQQGRRKGE
jgi:catechol 2,3-dioxygenase-like lactoylglutathione lyase family enzyme